MLELIFQDNASYEVQTFLRAGVVFLAVFLGLTFLKLFSRFLLPKLQTKHPLRRDFLQIMS